MPRTGITREDVFEAAHRMQRRGLAPTVALIRKALGRGSFSTIHLHFQDWKQQQWRAANKLAWVPPAVEAKAHELLRVIWDLAGRDAADELERLVAEYQLETIRLQQQLMRAREEIQALQIDNARLTEQIRRPS